VKLLWSRLKVNKAKTAVAPVWNWKFLGYRVWAGPKGEVRLSVAKEAIRHYKQRIRRSMEQVIEELREYVPGQPTLMTWVFPACTDLNFSNRSVRTRMPGGVAGVLGIIPGPYADSAKLLASRCIMFLKRRRWCCE